ncbi:MAG TPA: histidine--tRNA ligase [Chitinispirillaceae bacterium]|nr:histidine--tRNA ligase [Chitinispirillaceae bacterium]
MSVLSGPKGTRDFYPEDMAFQQYIFDSWKKTCTRYGFELYDAPMFEHLELYTQKSGNEIEKQLYAFEDKSQRKLALRPELTPSLARMVAQQGTNIKHPTRWYSIPRLFRYEKMQKGRTREFFQLNMDILGIAEVDADAELIAAVIDMMRDLGFTAGDFKVRISSRTLLDELFSASGLSKEQSSQLYGLLDKKNKIDESQFLLELRTIIPQEEISSKITRIFSTVTLQEIEAISGETPSILTLKSLFSLLDSYNFSDYIMFDIGIVRGLAYYTGIVFEVFDIQKSLRAIAGGGRYDKLVGLYGGPSTPAVGFAAGDVVLGELMKAKGLQPAQPPRSSIYLVSFDDVPKTSVIATAQKLRDNGISCEFALKNSNVGKQLKNANAARAPFTIFIGGDEAKEGCVRIKNMSSGNESKIKNEQLIGELKSLLKL